MTAANSDDKIVTIRTNFGMWGVGCYWTILEMVASQMKGKDPSTEATFSAVELSSFFGCKRNKLDSFLKCLRNVCEMKYERTGNIIRINIPKLLSIRDNYSVDLEETSKRLPSIDTDKDVDTEKDKTTIRAVVVSSPEDRRDLEQYLLQHWGRKGQISYANKAEFVKLFGEYGRENVLDAIALAAKAGVDKMSIRYVVGILKKKGAEQKQIHAKQTVATYVCLCGSRVNESDRQDHTEGCESCPLPDVAKANAELDALARSGGKVRRTKFILVGRHMESIPITEGK
jgi:hypothetical protein